MSKAKEYVWVTRDGKRIPISQMTDDHIKKAYKYFKPYSGLSKKHNERIYQLEKEMFRRQVEAL